MFRQAVGTALAILSGTSDGIAQADAPDLMRVVARAPEILRRFLAEFPGKEDIAAADRQCRRGAARYRKAGGCGPDCRRQAWSRRFSRDAFGECSVIT